MKTAGDLLREKRLTKELSLEDVALKTKIKVEYLRAIENSDFSSLPSSTFAKGFLRNYAEFLYLNPETILAMFRRDFTLSESGAIIPRGMVQPVDVAPKYFSVSLILTSLAILAFVGFLAVQLVSWRSLPKLTILQPQDGDTYGDKITVKGVADPDATVTVAGQLVILDGSGQFSLDMVFPGGTHSILVEAKNREGKTRQLERTFTVSK
jgi:hypothetical protein